MRDCYDTVDHRRCYQTLLVVILTGAILRIDGVQTDLTCRHRKGARGHPQWIDEIRRVSTRIGVGRGPSGNPDRIAFDIAPQLRIVVAEIIVSQLGLAIVILPGNRIL